MTRRADTQALTTVKVETPPGGELRFMVSEPREYGGSVTTHYSYLKFREWLEEGKTDTDVDYIDAKGEKAVFSLGHIRHCLMLLEAHGITPSCAIATLTLTDTGEIVRDEDRLDKAAEPYRRLAVATLYELVGKYKGHAEKARQWALAFARGGQPDKAEELSRLAGYYDREAPAVERAAVLNLRAKRDEIAA